MAGEIKFILMDLIIKYMKILLGHNFYRSSAPSGEDGVYRNERKLLEDNGVEIISYEKFNDDLNDSSLKNRVKIAMDSAWSSESYQELSKLIKKSKPDVVHFHSIFPQISPSAYAACFDNGVPVVHTLHNFRPICPGAMLIRDGKPCEDCVGTNLLPSLVHKCYRDSLLATGANAWQITRNRWAGNYQKVSRFITLTEFSASRYVKAGFNKDRLVVKPNFLPARARALKNEFLIKNNTSDYAVYVGRLSEEKGVRTLINAWCNVTAIPLKIIGDGVLRDELERFVKNNGLNVEFLGFLPNDEVLKVVAHSKLQVIPSECYEGFPMVVVEAYALGVPIVASRIGSLEEVIIEGETGLKFTPGSSMDLAEKVNKLIGSDSLRIKMKKNAQDVFKHYYTADANFKMLNAIYHQVIEENKEVIG